MFYRFVSPACGYLVVGAALFLSLLAAPAAAQPCQSVWDTTIGNPGVTSDGYVGPMTPWNGGGLGDRFYVGGSFTAIGGQNIKALARWNPANNTWSAVGTGLRSNFTNPFLTAILPYTVPGGNEELIVGGSFDFAGNQPGTAMLAKWNGQVWSSLSANLTSSGAVWALAAWNDRLYVGGGFATIGNNNLTVNGIASWNGEEWAALGTGITGSFAPNVFALKVFNDGGGEKLYAAGRFSSIGGVSGTIGRWNGNTWEPVGTNLFLKSTFGDIEAMVIFDDGNGPALYVGGSDFGPSGQPATSVAKWNGQTWTRIGANLGGRTTALAVFDDGDGPALYAGGTAQPGINYLAKLVNGQWVIVDGGVGAPDGPPWPSVFGLTAWNGKLYVGGDFSWVGPNQQAASGLVIRTSCPAFALGDLNCDGAVDFFDIDPFILVLNDPAAYMAQYPNCDSDLADVNQDGVTDFFDIDPFICLLVGC